MCQSPSRGTFRKLMYHIMTEMQSSNCVGNGLNYSSTTQSGLCHPFRNNLHVLFPDAADFPPRGNYIQQLPDRHNAALHNAI